MAAISDGGPAFPQAYAQPHECEVGMSLRDWLAGQVANGICANAEPVSKDGRELCDDIAATAYLQADALLAEREKADALGSR